MRVDGVDVRSLNVQWLRAQLALVSQEPVLFNTTVYDNIAYGDNKRTPTMDEVIDAAKKANIHNFIASLPLIQNVINKTACNHDGDTARIEAAKVREDLKTKAANTRGTPNQLISDSLLSTTVHGSITPRTHLPPLI
ncbi:hypothetical protein LSAT2_000353 [Lamellibrachia satsuma]|nr:hypothetical protein LSAT2_000353 [Lamellibrachia satsuma]